MTIDTPPLEKIDQPQPMVDEEDLESYVKPSRRRVLPRATWALLIALVGAGGFVAGVKAQHNSADSTTSVAALANAFRNGGGLGAGASGPSGPTGVAGATGTGGVAAPGAGATVGSIKLVDGDSVYVSDAQGNIVKVHVGSTATVSVTKTGTVADLKAGANVLVRGAAGADGTIEATSVNDLGAGGVAGGFGGRGG